MNKPKFNKIYFPGLISLCFVPLLCVWYFFHIGKFEKLTMLRAYWTNDTAAKQLTDYSTKHFNIHTYRKFHDMYLTGAADHDALVFEELQNKIDYFRTACDTVNSYRINFGVHTKYEEVVSLINMFEKPENIDLNYIWYKNSFSVFTGDPVAFKYIPPMPL